MPSPDLSRATDPWQLIGMMMGGPVSDPETADDLDPAPDMDADQDDAPADKIVVAPGLGSSFPWFCHGPRTGPDCGKVWLDRHENYDGTRSVYYDRNGAIYARNVRGLSVGDWFVTQRHAFRVGGYTNVIDPVTGAIREAA